MVINGFSAKTNIDHISFFVDDLQKKHHKSNYLIFITTRSFVLKSYSQSYYPY